MNAAGRIDLATTAPFRIGALCVEPALRQVSTAKADAETLEPRVMLVLVALARAEGAIVSRDQLIEQCWDSRIVGDDSINRVISRLRKLATAHGDDALFSIETISKVGYRLVGPVARVASSQPEPLNPASTASDHLIERIGQRSPEPAKGETLSDEPGPPSPLSAARGSSAPENKRAPVLTRFARRGLLAPVSAVAIGLLAAAGWLALRPTAPTEHALEVRLGDFQRLTADLPAGLPQSMRDEISAAFANDGLIGVSTAPAAPAGTTPAYVLAATARREADKIHVVARLSNERTGGMLWSNSFDLPAVQADAVPRKLAVDSGNVMRCALFGASTYPGTVPDTVLKDYFSYCHNVGLVEMQPSKGLDFAHRVVTALPDFSWGWSAVAHAALGVSFDATPAQRDEMRKIGIEAIATALKLDPANTEALDTKSLLIDPNDLKGREALLKQAIAARPLPCGCEHHYLGLFLQEVGRLDAAVVELRRAIDVLPLDGGAQDNLGLLLLETGHPEEAETHIDAGFDLMGAGSPQTRDMLVVRNAPLTGNWRSGLAAAQDAKWKIPDALRAALIATCKAMLAGDPASKAVAAAQLAALPPSTARRSRIDLLAALGAHRAALDWVASQAGDDPLIRIYLFSPILAPVRADPGFPELAQKLHLIEYWRASHTRPDFCVVKGAPPVCRLI